MAGNIRTARRGTPGGSARPEVSRDELIAEVARLREQLRSLRSSNRASNLTAFGRTFVRWTVTAICIVLAIHDLAGRYTVFWAHLDAKIESSSLKDSVAAISPRLWVLIITTFGTLASSAWNLRYRKLNKTLIKKVGKLTKELESRFDPDRLTSGLTDDGETGEKDRT